MSVAFVDISKRCSVGKSARVSLIAMILAITSLVLNIITLVVLFTLRAG